MRGIKNSGFKLLFLLVINLVALGIFRGEAFAYYPAGIEHYEKENGEIFFEVGNKVYFRRLPKLKSDAEPIWWKWAYGQESDIQNSIYSYHKRTGKVKKEFDYKGYDIYLFEKRFFINGEKSVYSVDLKGKKRKTTVKEGKIQGIFDGKLYLVKNGDKVWNEEKQIFENSVDTLVYKKGKIIKKYKNEFYPVYAGKYGIYFKSAAIKSAPIYGITKTEGNGKQSVWVKEVGTKKKEIYLGSMKDTDIHFLFDATFKNGKIYFSEFTGVLDPMVAGTTLPAIDLRLYEADPKKENSLKILNESAYFFSYRISVDKKGKAKLVHKTPMPTKDKSISQILKGDFKKYLHLKDDPNHSDEYEIANARYYDGNLYLLIFLSRGAWVADYYRLERIYAKIPIKNPKKAKVLAKDLMNLNYYLDFPDNEVAIQFTDGDSMYNIVAKIGSEWEPIIRNVWSYPRQDEKYIYYTIYNHKNHKVYRFDKRTRKIKHILTGKNYSVIGVDKKNLYVGAVEGAYLYNLKRFIIYDKKTLKKKADVKVSTNNSMKIEDGFIKLGFARYDTNSNFAILNKKGKKLFEKEMYDNFIFNKKLYYTVSRYNKVKSLYYTCHTCDLNGKNNKKISEKEFLEAKKMDIEPDDSKVFLEWREY